MPSVLIRTSMILHLAILCAGCTSIAEEFAQRAAVLNLRREVISGVGFEHVTYNNDKHTSKILHVYLDGDGTIWIAGRPANDPTPQNPMLLNMIAMDPAPAIYLGRPCYHGATAIGGCVSRFWLNERYSEAVIVSLASVVTKLLQQGDFQSVSWFGHSGGGTLATLLAARFSNTKALVTVAAALDLGYRASVDGYSGLKDSLNPALMPPLAPNIQQHHYAGAADTLEPVSLMAKAATQLGSKLIVIDGYDHVCCWEQIWPSVLQQLSE